MASYWQRMIVIALVLAIVVPISARHRRRSRRSDGREQYLRDLCSQTDRSDICWNTLKSELHRFDSSDEKDIVNGVFDLAIKKSKEIHDNLNQWYKDSNDDILKKKYHSCSKNYNNVNRNLEKMRRNLDSDNHRKISNQIGDVGKELDECKREFGSGSFNPANVGDRNNELGLYLDIVWAAIDRLESYYNDDRH